jgi:hypothetical protein
MAKPVKKARMSIAPSRQKITKLDIQRRMYKPSGDFLLEKIDPWTYKIHLTHRDAGRSFGSGFWETFDVEDAGKGYHGSALIVRHKLRK